MRRTRAEIRADELLHDRERTLEQLLDDTATPLPDKVRYHKQLASVRTKLRKQREQRERQRRRAQIERAERFCAKHADAPAQLEHPERTPEEIAALPASLQKLFYGIETSDEPAPVETTTPEPEPVQPRRSSFDPLLPAPQDAERALQWYQRLMLSGNRTAVFYQLRTGQIVNEDGFRFLGRMAVVAGRRILSDGTPATLYGPDVIEDSIPGAVFWHGAYFAPEDKQRILEALSKSWELPVFAPDDNNAPSIAVTHEEAALEQEIRDEQLRHAMRPERVYGY